MQELMAACKGYLGEINGKDGIVADLGIKYMGLADFVDSNYEKDVEGDFKTYIESFVAGVNAYAALHPKEVLLKKLFPVTPQDVLVGYMLGNVQISGSGGDLQRILNGRISRSMKSNFPKGSNAIAFSSNKTTDGKTYLAINSHQPLEGWYSWYEAHLSSEEGLEIIGGTFAGGITMFCGANQNLGWGHTVNHADFSDVFKLTVNTTEDAYLIDNEWLPLTKKKIKSKVKVLGFLKIPISKTMYYTQYGPTFKTDEGFFAWRFMAGQTLKMAEQWLKMNKATNLEEFKSALEMRGIVSTNIVYADREDNIFYISNGSILKRDPQYKWNEVLPGNTSATLGKGEMYELDELPQVLNPKSGWVFNTNNTPFTSTATDENPKETVLNDVLGYQETGDENNRSMRFLELMEEHSGKVSYEDFKRIKYDQQYPAEFRRIRGVDVRSLFKIKPSDYPQVSKEIELIQNWNRNTDVESEGATMFLATVYNMNELRSNSISREVLLVKSLQEASKELVENFGSINVPLGRFQRHSRGEVSLPMGGAPDVLAAIYSEKQKDGTYRPIGGESYIELVRFSKNGVEIESINAYGNAEELENPFATSQMSHFTKQKLKKMTFDKEEVLAKAIKVYQPK
jgi:acyl-homoserine-lactone acylase